MPAPQAAAPVQTQEPRSQVVEEHLPRLSDGPAEIRGKTYDIVAGELGPSGQGGKILLLGTTGPPVPRWPAVTNIHLYRIKSQIECNSSVDSSTHSESI